MVALVDMRARPPLVCGLLLAGLGLISPPSARAQTPLQTRNPSIWETPHPPYPESTRLSRGPRKGTLHLRTDARGQVVEAHLDPSTGSRQLDESTVQFVRANWHGAPNVERATELVFSVGTAPKVEHGPRIRVQTGADGHATKVEVLDSQGLRVDQAIIHDVLARWQGRPNSVGVVSLSPAAVRKLKL